MKHDSPTAPTADILIVDDQPVNLGILIGVLQARGYKVRPVNSGRQALEVARQAPPDLVLLDINMPGMDGYQVCAELKRDAHLRDVPVIFISAFNEANDKVRGFAAGGVDYVTKPFQIEEVEARVGTHLELARLRRHLEKHSELLAQHNELLEKHNERLEQQVALRTSELVEAYARVSVLDQAKSDFLNLISYELNSPLSEVFGTAEIILDKYARVNLDVHAQAPGNVDHLEMVRMYAQSRNRLLKLIADAQLLMKVELQTGPEAETRCALAPVVHRAWLLAMPFAVSRKVSLAPPPVGLGSVRGESESLVRAFQALFETAAKFANAGGTVRLLNAPTSPASSLLIEAEGWTVPADALPRFFSLLENFNPVALGVNLDLAPALAERIVRLYGGAVFVENLNPPGIRLIVRLKLVHELPKPEQHIRA
jgi:DNA-binding response OmpR family regulator